jgi:tricorn protease
MVRSLRVAALAAAVLAGVCPAASAQIDARMFRQPDVSATQIAFVYAGDIWVVPKAGGLAVRLSSPRGEEQFPRFSPDGSKLAFSANYDGNLDVYVVPTQGGDPVRVTHHPMADRLIDWHPDGARVLFVSSRESGRQRYNQFYLAGAGGGLPEKLAVPYGEFGSFSPDGQQIAYLPQSQAFRTWKRYRGGWSPDIWVFDLKTLAASNVTKLDAIDEFPMWRGDTIYFLSDRGATQKQNIWALNRTTGAVRQVTDFRDYDITFPSMGPSDIVFEAGGRLYLLDLATEKSREVPVQVVTDRTTLKPRSEKVAARIASATVSPTGKRAAFEARGDIFSVPAENGPVMNVSRTSGVAERYPRWSPDGRTLAYWSDKTGEYELTLRPADGAGAERTLTALGPGFRYAPHWSPDSARVAYVDQALKIRVTEIANGKTTEIDTCPIYMSHGTLEGLSLRWSADSRWLTWARGVADTANSAVFLYDTKLAKKHQATSGYFSDAEPVFDPDGKYLYFSSNRAFEPVYSDFDNGWSYPNSTRLMAAALRADVPSPLAPKNDVEGAKDEKKDDKKDEPKKDEPKKDEPKKDDGASKDAKAGADEKKAPKPVEIEAEGLEGRVVALPPKAGNYGGLQAASGKLLYRRAPRSGSGDEKSAIVYFDFEEREEKTVLDNADGFELTSDGKKLFVLSDKKYGMVDVKASQKIDKPMRIAELEALVDPVAEWKQMFADAYRFERDFFYDPNLHGVDWKATRDRYAMLIDAAVTRWDVNFVLGSFIAELNASHTYNGGGDQESAPTRGVGMLGVDWEVANGAYRIRRIAGGAVWDADARSPLAEPGVAVKAGDYVLAVNGVPLDPSRDPWAAFEGLANTPVQLTVNS